MDVVCIGELLVDIIGQEEGSLSDVQTFKRYAGGAAGNVAAGTSKLGLKSGFIGKVGNDPFGEFLIKTLNNYKVDTTQICRDDNRKTGLAFVSLDERKVPDYLFYRDPSASMFLSPEDIKDEYIRNAKIIYFSSISLVNEPFRSATYKAIKLAQEYDLLVSFDPNIRLSLWNSQEEARNEILNAMRSTDILKINTEELSFLFGQGDREELCKKLIRECPSLKLVTLTLGSEGALIMDSIGNSVHVNAVPVKVKDTTGAGDTFISAILSFILKSGSIYNQATLYKLGQYANAAAALAVTKQGVIPAMPTQDELEEFLKNINGNETS